MKIFLTLFLCLALTFSCYAEDEIAEPKEDMMATEQTSGSEPYQVITRKIEREVVPLPECNDGKLIAATREYIEAFFQKSENKNILFRRRRYFILNSLDKFEKENIANYKTEETRPVSDAVIDLKMNKNVLEENMLLCKNQSKNKFSANIYILVHPIAKGYKVILLNLDDRDYIGEETSFTYEN